MRVRFFGYRGVSQIPVINPKQHFADSVFVMVEPYEWRLALNSNGVTPVLLPAITDNMTQLLRIEVPDDQAIRYEINPPGRNVAVSTDSPILSGLNHFSFSYGWALQFMDASGT